jgi:outer membrane protein insertion porin family
LLSSPETETLRTIEPPEAPGIHVRAKSQESQPESPRPPATLCPSGGARWAIGPLPARLAGALGALLALLAGHAPSAEARYERYTGSAVVVEHVEIVGNKAFSRKKVLTYLASLKGSFFRSPRYRRAQVLAETRRLEGAYRAEGYLEARVVGDPEVTYPKRKDRAHVRIEVYEGPQTFVSHVAFTGNAVIDTTDLADAVRLKRGKPFDRSLIAPDRYRIYALYADRGYAYAHVDTPRVDFVADSVSIHYAITEGKIATFGEIFISGNNVTLGSAIRRELVFKRGDVFSRKKILESQFRVYATGLFSVAEFEPESLAAQPDTIAMIVRVQEKKLHSVGFGVGYGSADFARVSADWNHKNVLGTGKQLELRATASRLFADRPNNYRGEATLIEPWLLNTRTRMSLTAFYDSRDIENFEVQAEGPDQGRKIAHYRLIETGARVNLSRELSPRLRVWGDYNFTHSTAKDPSEPIDPALIRPEVKRSIDAAIAHSVRDNLFNPTHGSLTQISTEYAGTFLGGDSDFWRLGGRIAVYWRFPRRSVFGARLEVGTVHSLVGETGIPDHERFRLGGATTVRGYGEDRIGPGNFLLMTNVEWRVPLFWHLGVGLFADGGNAWGEAGDLKLQDFRLSTPEGGATGSDYRYGVGAGLRITTPVGPARLDWGTKLKRAPGEGASEFHLALGHAF